MQLEEAASIIEVLSQSFFVPADEILGLVAAAEDHGGGLAAALAGYSALEEQLPWPAA